MLARLVPVTLLALGCLLGFPAAAALPTAVPADIVNDGCPDFIVCGFMPQILVCRDFDAECTAVDYAKVVETCAFMAADALDICIAGF